MIDRPASNPTHEGLSRRTVLRRLFAFSASAAAAILVYPLLKFTRFTVKPKPKYFTVKAPLPLSGYHAERDFILFADKQSAHAVSRTCTHLGCRIQYLEDKQYIECPCHQSRFTVNGIRLSGPAQRDLPKYSVEISRDQNGEPTAYVVELA